LRSISAFRWRSSMEASRFLRASSSLSSSSFATVGGLRLNNVTGGVNSCLRGTTPCVSNQ
jgi:hypothetical protein